MNLVQVKDKRKTDVRSGNYPNFFNDRKILKINFVIWIMESKRVKRDFETNKSN